MTSHPPRVAHLLDSLQLHLFVQAHIRLNPSKTRAWNAAGVQPPALPAAPDGARLWVGDPGLPASECGLRILGTPLGTPEYIAAQLESLSTFFARLPDVPDVQVAWLLLLFCALPKAQYVLRVLPPHQTDAASHDRSVLACLAALLRVESSGALLAQSATCGRAQLAMQHGGRCLRSTTARSCAAYFASWADALRAIEARDAQLWATAALQLQRPACTSRLTALRDAVHSLEAAGFQAPPWNQLARTSPPQEDSKDDDPADFTRGWQRSASRAVDRAFAVYLAQRLDHSSRALLESQSGPFAAKVFTTLPTSLELRLEPASFRVLLLRRLRLQLPLVPATCPCRRRLDALGDHRASCPRSGLLRPRAIPLERADARMCREAGATVSTNVHNQDDRRIEVIANGLLLWGGAQLAVDTTLVSALDSAGQLRRQQRSTTGAALRIARRAKERTYPELLRAERFRLVVIGIELGGGGARRQPNSSGCSLGAVPVRPRMSCDRVPRPLTSPAGLPGSRLQQPALWQPASFPSRWETLPTSTRRHSISAMSSPRLSLLRRWPADCPCGPRREPWIFSNPLTTSYLMQIRARPMIF